MSLTSEHGNRVDPVRSLHTERAGNPSTPYETPESKVSPGQKSPYGVLRRGLVDVPRLDMEMWLDNQDSNFTGYEIEEMSLRKLQAVIVKTIIAQDTAKGTNSVFS